MRKLIAILLVLVLIGIVYTNIVRSRRFSAPSPYDYPVADSLDLYYHDPMVVQAYMKGCTQLGQLARSLWTEYRVDVRFLQQASLEDQEKAKAYWSLYTQTQYLEQRLKQSKEWKVEGFNNTAIRRLEEEGISPQVIIFENTYGLLANLPWALGSRGDHITMIQEYLVAQGFTIPVDGTYGIQTKDAVKEIQRQNGDLMTGIPTLNTLAYILEPSN
ncbi:MAG: peptidoglycan-binding domain-containing protein [Bacteroidota bacterium]